MIYPPKEDFRRTARIQSLEDYQRLYKKSIERPEEFWGEMAQALTWFHPPDTVVDADPDQVDFAWFGGGRLNACYNAVDRHVREHPGRPAIIWARNEPGQYELITWRDLKHNVGRVANVLKAHGVQKGDRVCIYLPMVPELAYTMLACARIGAVHSVVFAGFSAESLRERILDSGARVLVTANEGPRGAKRIHTKAIADEAVEGLSQVRVGARGAPHRGGRAHAGRPRLVARRGDEQAPRHLPRGVDGLGGSPLHPLHLGQHRKAQGRDAHHGRLPRLRRHHAPLRLRPAAGRRALLHRGHGLDYRPHLSRSTGRW